MPDPKRYEQCVRVFTVFFSALMGFGLKQILKADWGNFEIWTSFAIGLFLFLRILFGSANHLWLEYMATPPRGERQRTIMLWECFCMVLLGSLSVYICYAKDVPQFLAGCSLFALTAAFIVIADFAFRPAFKRRHKGFSQGWLGYNLFQSSVAFTGSLFISLPWVSGNLDVLRSAMLGLAFLSAVIFFLDLRLQLSVLESAAYADPTLKEKRYEQCVRVFTVFFSMLMGFGLKHLADNEGRWTDLQSKAAFVIAMLLFLRFLFGSANYFWREYILQITSLPSKQGWLLWDCICITVLGALSVYMCYAKTFSGFLGATASFGWIAAIVVAVDVGVRKFRKAPGQRDFWLGWVFVNAIHASGATIVRYLLEDPFPVPLPWIGHLEAGDFFTIGLVVLGLLLLLYDLSKQLSVMDSP